MADMQSNGVQAVRPKPVHTSRSFPRMDNPNGPDSPRKRASTLQEQGMAAVPTARVIPSSPELLAKRHVADVFENRDDEEEQDGSDSGTPGPELQLPSTFDELPIEIRS